VDAFSFDWSAAERALPFMLQGMGTTLQLTLLTEVISMELAVPLAVARMTEIGIIRRCAQGYVELFRCTPLLVQLFWIFYVLPILTGGQVSGFLSALIALSANLTAFMAEAYRSGFQSVPVEQIEAGKMLQLSAMQRLRYIIVPQAIRQQIPVILSLNISTFKDTALVSTITVADLMFVANTQATITYRPVEILTLAAALYFIIAFPISIITSHLESRMRDSGSAPARRKALRPVAAQA
jgi:polar amino acid transport system permease protein